MKKKGPTIPELQKSIQESFKRWDLIRRKGTHDPFYEDGVNLGLVRNHILSYQETLKELCKTTGTPCPKEAKRRPPAKLRQTFCAKGSKAGPCVKRRRR